MYRPQLALLTLTTTFTPLASSFYQECIYASQNGRSNGISRSFFYSLADACKDAIYPNTSPQTRTDDAGGKAHRFRFSSPQEGWGIRFEPDFSYAPSGPGVPRHPCEGFTVKCSDFVGKDATGQAGVVGSNVQVCSARNEAWNELPGMLIPRMDAYYHGGNIPYILEPGQQTCGSLLIWRCKPDQCGEGYDSLNDPRLKSI